MNTKILSKLTQAYELGRIDLIGRTEFGTSSTNYILLIINKMYHLKKYEISRYGKVNKLVNVYSTLEHAKVNSQIVLPMKTIKNEYFVKLGNYYYVIFPFVRGSPTLLLNKQNIQQICVVLKDFNSIVNLVDQSLFFKNSFNPSCIKNSLLTNLNLDAKDEILMLKRMENLKLKSDVILHGDTDYTNFLFTDKLEALLDVDECFIGDKREEVILTTLNFCLNRNGILFNKNRAVEFLKNFDKLQYSAEIIDYFVYKHIFSSLNTFSKKNTNSEDTNKLILKYFLSYFKSYKLERAKIHDVFNVL